MISWTLADRHLTHYAWMSLDVPSCWGRGRAKVPVCDVSASRLSCKLEQFGANAWHGMGLSALFSCLFFLLGSSQRLRSVP